MFTATLEVPFPSSRASPPSHTKLPWWAVLLRLLVVTGGEPEIGKVVYSWSMVGMRQSQLIKRSVQGKTIATLPLVQIIRYVE